MSSENIVELSLPPITQSGLMATKVGFSRFISPVLFVENGIVRLKHNSLKILVNNSKQYSRMSFVDPSNHLIEVVEDLQKLIYLDNSNRISKISGLTFKDKDFVNLIKAYHSRIETEIIVQEGDSTTVPEISNTITNISNWNLNQTSIFVARHIVEHIEDPLKFMNHIINALPESGYILIEVPSSSRMYSGSLFPDFWDEHKSYFDLKSIGNLFLGKDFEILLQKEYKTEAENVLILFGRKSRIKKKISEKYANVNLIANLKSDFERIKNIVWNYENKNYNFIFVGATHAVVNFIDLFVTYPDRCVIIDNSESRLGNFVTKYSIKIVKASSKEFLDQKCIWLTSISADRLKLYYGELTKNQKLLNLDEL